MACGNHALQRQHQRAAGGDVIHHGQPRPRRQRGGNIRHDGIGVRIGKWHLRFHDTCAGALAHMAHRVAHRAVAVGQDDDLVTRLKTQ